MQCRIFYTILRGQDWKLFFAYCHMASFWVVRAHRSHKRQPKFPRPFYWLSGSTVFIFESKYYTQVLLVPWRTNAWHLLYSLAPVCIFFFTLKDYSFALGRQQYTKDQALRITGMGSLSVRLPHNQRNIGLCCFLNCSKRWNIVAANKNHRVMCIGNIYPLINNMFFFSNSLLLMRSESVWLEIFPLTVSSSHSVFLSKAKRSWVKLKQATPWHWECSCSSPDIDNQHSARASKHLLVIQTGTNFLYCTVGSYQ